MKTEDMPKGGRLPSGNARLLSFYYALLVDFLLEMPTELSLERADDET